MTTTASPKASDSVKQALMALLIGHEQHFHDGAQTVWCGFCQACGWSYLEGIAPEEGQQP